MLWQEDKAETPEFKVPDDIVDLSFGVNCKMLPMDHAHALSTALQQALPWLAEEESAGLHLIHGAESGNGWFRPQDTEGAVLHLSRRTRMWLRVPKERIDDARALEGMTLDIDGYALEVGSANVKLLSTLSTLFARHVIADPAMSEDEFMQHVVELMAQLDIRVSKMLCGKSHDLRTPDAVVHTRSVMVADLDRELSIRLQQKGIGPGRKMGCGLFLPHKGIKAVKETH